MSPREIDLQPDAATRAGKALADAGEDLTWSRRNRGGRIEAAHADAPWGKDDLGNAFAMGKGDQSGYLESAEMLLKVWKSAAERTAQMGADVVKTVEELVDVDQAASGQLEGIQKSI